MFSTESADQTDRFKSAYHHPPNTRHPRLKIRHGSSIHEKLSEDIIGAAMKVLNALKPGLDEKLHENALAIELTKRGHRVDQQKIFQVHYETELIGTLVPDLIIDKAVIVDAKVVTTFTDTHLAQMTGYLAITGLHLALLLNFKFSRLSWKRVVRSHPIEPPV